MAGDFFLPSKASLRETFLERTLALPPAARSSKGQALVDRLRPILASHGQTVAVYLALRSEPDLAPLFASAGGLRFALPVMDDATTLHWVAWVPGSRTVRNHAGIQEPANRSARLEPSALSAVVIPGVAFAPNGARLGRGGGFYDRALALMPASVRRVGVCFEEAVADALPQEPHDVRVHTLVTDAWVIEIATAEA